MLIGGHTLKKQGCWSAYTLNVCYNFFVCIPIHFLEFSDKKAAALFWNGEIETELCVPSQLDYYGLFSKNEDWEVVSIENRSVREAIRD